MLRWTNFIGTELLKTISMLFKSGVCQNDCKLWIYKARDPSVYLYGLFVIWIDPIVLTERRELGLFTMNTKCFNVNENIF